MAEFKLRFDVLLDTNTGLNFLFIVEVPPFGKCHPGGPPPTLLSLRHCANLQTNQDEMASRRNDYSC